MFLALREMARAKVRFGLLAGALALLVFLILFQQSLQNGLITSFVGAIRTQSAPVLVYNVDSQRVIQGSVITPDQEALVLDTPGVAEVGRIGQGTFTGLPIVDGVPSDDTFDTTVIGYEAGPDGTGPGAPTTVVKGRLPTSDFEAVVSDANIDSGFDIGATVRLLPGNVDITIVGLAEQAQLNATPTLFTTYATHVTAVKAVNPDAGEPRPNVLGVVPEPGVSAADLATAINAQ